MQGKINPTKVLVLDQKEGERKTASGLIIPDVNSQGKPPAMKGTVVLTGEGNADVRMIYNIGDTVYYNPHAGLKFTMEDTEYRLIDQQEIFLGREKV